MSEFVLTNKEDLTAFANAVRASTGSTSTYNVSELFQKRFIWRRN